jgi:hypothetical protein
MGRTARSEDRSERESRHERPKTTAGEDRSETQVDGASRKLPPEARTGANRPKRGRERAGVEA